MIQNDKIQSRRTFLYNLGITGGSIVFLPNRYLFFKKERKNTHNFSVCKENKGDNLQNQLSIGVGNKQQYVFNAKSNCDRGGVIENIYFKNIQVGNCRQLIRMEMEYKDIRYHPNEHPYPPLYRNIYFENITCEQAEEYGINIAGLEQSPIQNVHLKDVTIKKANPVMNLVNVAGIECDHVIINGKKQDSKF